MTHVKYVYIHRNILYTYSEKYSTHKRRVLHTYIIHTESRMAGSKLDRNLFGMISKSMDIRIIDTESRPPGMKVFSNAS